MSTPKFQNRYRIPSARYEHHDYNGGQTSGQVGGQTSSQKCGQTWKEIERQIKYEINRCQSYIIWKTTV